MANWPERETWEAMKAGDACEMCEDIHLPENQHSFLVADLDITYVRLPRNQYKRGWTILALKRHASELFELTAEELSGFWGEVSAVAEVLNQIHSPAKMNYMVFGNRCPHIHCHLIPVTFEDDPNQPIHMLEKEVFLADAEYQETIHQMRRLINGEK